MANIGQLNAADLRTAIDLFYAGDTVVCVAGAFDVSDATISGLFNRARVVRECTVRRADRQFDFNDSMVFRRLVAAGRSPVAAGATLGKAEKASLQHARALGLRVGEPLTEVRAREAARPARLAPIAERFVGGGQSVGNPDAIVSDEHDAAHVAACLAEGGFDRYDDTFDWLLNMAGERIAAISEAAKDVLADARAQLALLDGPGVARPLGLVTAAA